METSHLLTRQEVWRAQGQSSWCPREANGVSPKMLGELIGLIKRHQWVLMNTSAGLPDGERWTGRQWIPWQELSCNVQKIRLFRLIHRIDDDSSWDSGLFDSRKNSTTNKKLINLLFHVKYSLRYRSIKCDKMSFHYVNALNSDNIQIKIFHHYYS